MPSFMIYSGAELIGSSELEAGDPPMGVAFGRLFPAPAYSRFHSRLIVGSRDSTASLDLSARTEAGVVIESSGGVFIQDLSAEAGEECIEVSILGISYPEYQALFPGHVAGYENQFRNDG